MTVIWISTSIEVYREIYAAHYNDLRVFESYTEQYRQCTAWGFKGADYPIIKSTNEHDEHRYYIASCRSEPPDDDPNHVPF